VLLCENRILGHDPRLILTGVPRDEGPFRMKRGTLNRLNRLEEKTAARFLCTLRDTLQRDNCQPNYTT
jgi:hypothetical protein